LFNCTTNVVGGGAKNALLFILLAMEESTFDWCFAVSDAVAELLKKKGVSLDDRFHIFKISPAKSITARKQLKKLVRQKSYDLVYTMAGPAYVNFPARHVQGISNPYITHADREAFECNRKIISALKLYIGTMYRFWFSQKADHFIFQTEVARNSYVKRKGTTKNQTTIIPNAFDDEMKNYFESEVDAQGMHDTPIVFCPGANYIHKAFQYIPAIAKELKDRNKPKLIFVLTLKDDDLWKSIESETIKLGVYDWIKNIGPFDYDQVIKLYANSDIVYVPSLLETFSASYLEAIAARKPLIVSQKQFAKDVCGNYALYANPKDSKESANAIEKVLAGYRPPKYLAEEILDKFGSQKQRFVKIIQTLHHQLQRK
jgi:glycosyltransferase involved in cell wall biosynthesis